MTSKKGQLLSLGQLIKYIRKIFTEKYVENVQQKLVPGFNLILVNSPKYRQYIQETLLQIRLFWIRFKQSGFIFILRPSLF